MSLRSVLKSTPQVRKLLGRRELAIIEKQLLGVRLTQSEKNRLSRDIRKKFAAISALAPYSPEFNLKPGSETKRELEDAKAAILESPFSRKIRRIIVYGSYADKTLALSSDIDVAVEFDEITLRQATEFRRAAMGKVGERFDVQVFNFLPDKVKAEIRAKGRVAYERKDN
ncbi:MAG: nucleotidyltransferase domain-containing protein [Candidatus Micrarchaeota archaeon]